jgi:hypothetical protein
MTADATIALEPQRVRLFADLLARHPRSRIDRAALWRAFAKAFPHRPQGREEREWLVAALSAAAAAGVIRLPAPGGRRWDRRSEPAVPVAVDRTDRGNGETRAGEWRRFPWHPTLAWVADLPRLSADAEQFLRRVHDGLVYGSFQHPAPLRYRSHQLTGDEKRLSALARTTLFGSDRLSLTLLGCFPDRVPLAWARVGDADMALVVENAGLFSVAVSVLRQLSRPPYGLVAYGAGAGAEQALPGLADVGRPVTSVMYVGDLDHAGLRIAQAAARALVEAALPALEPAPGLHERMLKAAARLGHPSGWPAPARRTRADDAQLVSWLPAVIQPRVHALLAAGRRIPEEVLGPEELLEVWG